VLTLYITAGQTNTNSAKVRSMSEILLTVTGLCKSYGRVKALDDVTFEVRCGEILGLLGPNGSGKTTLLECVAGLQPPDRGHISGAKRSDILFYVPDGIAPWPEQPLFWALEFAVAFFGGSKDLYTEIIDRFELTSFLHIRLGALSKGQRKRALLAIGFLTPQLILLVDEPFDGLDLRQGRAVVETLRWHASCGRTLLVSMHQIGDAPKICDHFVLLNAGRVCATGTIDQLTDLAARRSGQPGLVDFEDVFLALT